MFPGLSSLGLSAGGGGPSASDSDSSAGQTNPTVFNNAFSLGGSGKLSSNAEAGLESGGGNFNSQIVIAAVAGIAIIAAASVLGKK